MHERKLCLTFLLLGFILDHIFCPKKDNLSCPVFVFPRGMSNGMCDPVLYHKSEAQTFHEYSGTVPLQYLRMIFAKTTSLYFSKMRWIDTRS